MQIRLYLRMLQSGWWIVVLSALSALVIALTTSYLTPPSFRATARFLISPNGDLMTGRDIVNSLTALDKRSIASTYAEILDSDRIYQEASAILQIDPALLRNYALSAVVLPDSNILTLSATGPNPSVSAALVNSIGQQGIGYIRNIYQVYTISFLDPALPPLDPVSPNPKRDASLSLVLGLILGTILAVLRGHLSVPIEAMRQNMATDLLSSAYTRAHMLGQIEAAIAQEPGAVSLALVCFDQLAVEMPKTVLRQTMRRVVERLRADLRGIDLVGRWNETTFVILLPATGVEGAVGALKRIRASFSQPLDADADGAVTFKPRLGVATHQAGDLAATLVERAELSLSEGRIPADGLPVDMHPQAT